MTSTACGVARATWSARVREVGTGGASCVGGVPVGPGGAVRHQDAGRVGR
jgi:hypothetical protein